MGLPLTPQILAAAYEYLRTTPPFRGWRLPPASEVKFMVSRHRDREADFQVWCQRKQPDIYCIRVSCRNVGHTTSLLAAIGHEMVHLRQWRKGDHRLGHNPMFRRLSRTVCRHHGWDVLTFIGPS